ncbi:SDR family NAD(P)-dependent oxidoreductase [Pseudarthrobacter sp. 1C304]|uniref:SDR family NAD(P)-dependent oxidoreductase n=1 Tax=Pseudarthrobacter sp. 1C304 TaxID=3457438 RepID=UPI003FD3EB9B
MTAAAAPRRVLVVGANSEIAAAIADIFSAAGGQVAGVGLDHSRTEHYTHFAVADVAVSTEADRVVQWAIESMGGLDTVVLAAARITMASAEETTDEMWRSSLASVLDTAFFVSRAALPHLSAGSTIVAVSSVNGHIAAPALPAYATAKAGLEGLVRQLAFEYGMRGIRVNAVVPGTIKAPPYPPQDGYPLGRTGTPQEVAEAVKFLATPVSSFITGASLPVDGGLMISSPAAWLRPDLRERWLPEERR